jgi:adhesin transport system membrane fusion protein
MTSVPTLERDLAFDGATESIDAAKHRLTRTPRWIRSLGIVLLLFLVLLPFLLLFAPWQQTVRGSGRVVAFNPLDREQAIEAPISGRVTRWWVQEGTPVEEGDPLFEITDIDELRLQRLESQLSAQQAKLASFEAQAVQYEMNVDNVRSIGELKVQANEAKVEEADQKVTAAEADLEGANAELVAAEFQVERKRRLFESGTGAISQRQLEVAEADYGVAKSKVENATAKLEGAKADYRAAVQDLEGSKVDVESKVASARAVLEETRSKIAETNDKIAEAQSKLSRQQSQLVPAPRAGVVHRLSGNQGGEIVKAGDPMVVLVPEAQQRSVEIVVDGNDAPLVRLDAKVMIQFEGWPVVQFPGAPELMYGVFEGRVALIDPTDNGQGQFRILVTPAEGETWPEPRFLRQGVRSKAWVLLNEVPLGKELWRQLNGFPPVMQTEDPKDNVARKRLK